MEDKEIIELYFQRDEQAIAASDEKYGHYLYTVSFNVLRNREDAEECVNDTWIRSWNAIPPTYPEVLKAFFAKITRNLSLNLLKEQTAQKRGGTQYDAALDELTDVLSESGSVEDEVDRILLTETINRFLKTLPETQRVLFVKRYWFMKSVNEICEECQMGESRVKTTLFRVRNRLKEYLRAEGIQV